jgi:hypothetical protein
MGTKRKARKPDIARVGKTARETGEIVALLRELRESMRIVEELDPDNSMLREYQSTRGWVIIEPRRIRASLELALRGISRRERKIAAEHLRSPRGTAGANCGQRAD